MEIRSGKADKSEKVLYSAVLLIHLGLIIFGIQDIVKQIENAEKDEIGSIILVGAVFFLYFMIMIKLAIMALIEENVAYRLDENGISLVYRGKIKRTYRWG